MWPEHGDAKEGWLNSVRVTGWSHLCSVLKDETQKCVAGVLADRTPGGKNEAGKCMVKSCVGSVLASFFSFVL